MRYITTHKKKQQKLDYIQVVVFFIKINVVNEEG